MKKRVFNVMEYKEDSPTAYIAALLEQDQLGGLLLAMDIKTMERESELAGYCKERIDDNSTLWVLSRHSCHVIYCFFEKQYTICYLIAFNGNINEHLTEAKKRLRDMLD